MGGRVDIVTVTDEGLGHSSHVVHLGDGVALVIDPARLPVRQRRLVAARGWRIAWTADTHSHADYISGSVDLAADGARFLAPARARLEVDHHGLEPAESIEVADGVALRAIPTPGHTPEHLAYLLLDHDVPVALFSGGSLMVGTVGRTDLLGADQAEPLARQLHRALHAEILTLPDDLPVHPTHGAGSFCSAPGNSARSTTIGLERATNPFLAVEDEDEFVGRLLGGLGSFPTYFRALPERNRLGPTVYPSPPELVRLPAERAAALVEGGAVLVDARPIDRFAAGHPAGAVSNALRGAFAAWLGWIVPLDTPLVFLLDDDQDRADLVRQCLTIGHERLLGEVDGGIEAWTAAGLPAATVRLVDPAAAVGTVLDVRQDDEWRSGHLPDAVHIELGALSGAPVPAGSVTVMCGHGERAMTAAGLLRARGRADVRVLAGGPDDWSRSTGRALVTEP
jgi:glyoxylase-like metal-dependent hydrolase (beta-lactamase superfamily II)/rhodanese-related sulfurtransferase